MSYITREIEEAVKIMAESFKIVLITGPRQVVKTN
jgi:predicted AAA+ superfamily ATPase